MNNGFYKELEELKKEGKDNGFGFLENIYVDGEYRLYDFLHGWCDEFAAALSDFYGYAVESVVDNTYTLIHVYCVSEINGVKAFIDARGITTDAVEFYEEFADFCTYRNGRLYDLKGECEISHYKDTYEMYSDKNREKNQDKALFAFLKDNNSYYDINLFKYQNITLDDLIDKVKSQPEIPENKGTDTKEIIK